MKINPTTYPVSWFRDRNLEKSLVLKPPYQRKPVWTNDQKAYLIDTIIRKYNIPEIYIHRETSPGGQAIYNIVDGQQRLRTILEFVNGEFPLSGEYNPDYTDYKFEELPVNIQMEIWGYTIFAREISEGTEEEVRNLFRRMNKNVVALNPQELRHATYSGFFIKLMEELAEDTFWPENKIVTPNEIRRMNDVQFISDLFISMMHGIQDKTKDMDRYYEMYEEEFTDRFNWSDRFSTIKQVIIKIIPNLKETRWKNKSDFYTLFMVLNKIVEEKKSIREINYAKIREALLEFSNDVSEAVKKEQKGRKYSKYVIDYANAVTKSTTDKDRRTIRHKIIFRIISNYIERSRK